VTQSQGLRHVQGLRAADTPLRRPENAQFDAKNFLRAFWAKDDARASNNVGSQGGGILRKKLRVAATSRMSQT
jgi:hypothetical protein